MEVSMGHLALVSMYAFVLGVLFGAFYDVFRILRVSLGISKYGGRQRFCRIYEKGIKNIFDFKRSHFAEALIVGVGDVLYFTVSGAAYAIFINHFNYGRFRWFVFLFCLLGFVLYYFSVGMVVIRFSSVISQILELVISVSVHFVLLPFKMLFKSFKKMCLRFISPALEKLKKAVDNSRRKRYTKHIKREEIKRPGDRAILMSSGRRRPNTGGKINEN